MRKAEREIKDQTEIEDILSKAETCYLGLSQNNVPYVVPMNFGYRDRCLYLHCAREGKKLDIIKENNKVCFAVAIDREMIPAEAACGWGMKYRSVIGNGTASLVEGNTAKSNALNIIMQHYAGKEYRFPAEMLANTSVIRIAVETISGKKAKV